MELISFKEVRISLLILNDLNLLLSRFLILLIRLQMKKVYVGMIGDLVHPGHINILNEAAKLGEVIVGLYTDSAVGSYTQIPYLDYENRKTVVENIKSVSRVIPQETHSYKANLQSIKPDIVVHGDDWQEGYESQIRAEVIEVLKEWGGELIELPYTPGISSSMINSELHRMGITSTMRMSRLRRLIGGKKVVKVLEVHNGLSGLIAENAKVTDSSGKLLEFDGMWSSSLTDSTAKGKPDIEAVDTTSRLQTINDIFEVTTKPLIYDGDTGGKTEHFEFTVRSLERTGVSAVIIEDKTGLKKNSLLGNEVAQTQDTIENFCEKIKAGKAAQITRDFMVIARCESLILDQGMDDALTRSFAYANAGADGIMIHSRQKSPDEIFEFVSKFREKDQRTPIVVVPTSFNQVTVEEFGERGVNVVIYANHMLRSAYPGMMKVAESILQNGRTMEVEDDCMSIKKILNLIPGTN